MTFPHERIDAFVNLSRAVRCLEEHAFLYHLLDSHPLVPSPKTGGVVLLEPLHSASCRWCRYTFGLALSARFEVYLLEMKRIAGVLRSVSPLAPPLQKERLWRP